MPRYFVHDLESEKLHIHTGGKADWLTIPEADRNAIKRACLWSNRYGCWVSRAKGSKAHILARFYPSDLLGRNGFEDRGEEGERLSFADKIEAQQERAEDRAERMEGRAGKAEADSASRHKAARAIASFIPMGQPILVGHHSEKRHRRDLAKIDANMRKAIDASDKAAHYARRAELARATAEGSQFSDPRYLGNRIKEQETEERLLLRRLDDIDAKKHGTGPDTVDWLWRLLGALDDVRDKLGYYRHCLETCGVKVYDRESLKGMKVVFLRGGWHEIVRLNPKTVAVPNTCFPSEEDQRKYAMKYPYTEVKDAR